MKTILFVYNNPMDGSYGGAIVTEKAYSALSKRYKLIDYFINKKRHKIITYLINICLYSGNLFINDIWKIIRIIKKNKDIRFVFLDTSLFGRLAKKIRKIYPGIKIIVNFHNNENEYFYGLFKASGLIYLPIWLSAKYNERLSLKASDMNIFITNKDKDSMDSVIKKPSIIIPVTLADRMGVNKKADTAERYILFVGINSYANIEGVKYLINNIAPHISCNIKIIGKNLRAPLLENKVPDNVIIYDFIEDLSDAYINASAVIIPLFNGSGMKVKTAEAMMYGKKIMATTLAFCGYKTNKNSCIACNTDEEFITAINNLDLSRTFYEESRQLFLKYYSSSNNEYYYSQIEK